MAEVGSRLLMHSRLGSVWIIRLALLIVIVLIAAGIYRIDRYARITASQLDIFRTPQAKKKLWLLALGGCLTVALMFTQSLTSHAVAVQPRPGVAVALDTIHLLAVGAWLGGLISLRIGMTPLLQKRQSDFIRLTRATLSPFSIVAVLSVTTLFASGLYATGVHVASPNAMLTTLYGNLLMIKISLFMVVGLFGLVNSMMLHPDLFSPVWRLLRRPEGWTPLPLKRMPLVTMAEGGVGLVVLFIVGILSATPPANGVEYRYAGYQQPNPMTQAAGDLAVTLEVQPNQAGTNTFNIQVKGPQGATPEIARLILRFKYQGESMGDHSVDAMPMGDGMFHLQGDQYNMIGPWGVDVVVRRLGVMDSTAHFDWVVPPVGEPPVVPNLDWQPVLTKVGVVMLSGLLLGGIGLLALERRRRTRPLKE
jgi:putative copper export protein